MSIVKAGATPLDGLTLGRGGTPFVPNDDNSSHAIYERHGRSCGVTYELGREFHYLRFSPDWQLPEGARARGPWNRFVFGLDDDRTLDLNVDYGDGEVRYFYSDTPLEELEDIERAIDEGVELVTSIYPDVVGFVARQLATRGGDGHD